MGLLKWYIHHVVHHGILPCWWNVNECSYWDGDRNWGLPCSHSKRSSACEDASPSRLRLIKLRKARPDVALDKDGATAAHPRNLGFMICKQKQMGNKNQTNGKTKIIDLKQTSVCYMQIQKRTKKELMGCWLYHSVGVIRTPLPVVFPKNAWNHDFLEGV